MKLLSPEEKKYVIEFSVEEFHSIINAVDCVDQYFDQIDPVMLNMNLAEIESLRDKLSAILSQHASIPLAKQSSDPR